MKIKRAVYLGYYLKQLDRAKFILFLDYVRQMTGRTNYSIIADILKSVFTYNISVLEYFQFHFYNLSREERAAWAGTGHMYEYQLKMNPLKSRDILENKTLFYKNYKDFFVHRVADIQDLENIPGRAAEILSNPSGKVVFKVAEGNCGTDVEIAECKIFETDTLISFMKLAGYAVVEEFIQQHPELNRLSPSAVNTVRIFTQLNNQGDVDFLGCRLRISVNSSVDNMAAGNLAAPIDTETGIISGPGVYSDITKPEMEHHPITDVKIPGFQIPFWNETLEMVRNAALLHPENKSIGWDIVITEEGPGLIEGNHDWCKLLWQLPAKRGLKPLLMDA